MLPPIDTLSEQADLIDRQVEVEVSEYYVLPAVAASSNHPNNLR